MMIILKRFYFLITLIVLFVPATFGQNNEIALIQIENIGPCPNNEGNIVIFNQGDSLHNFNLIKQNSSISNNMVMYYIYSDSFFFKLVCLIKYSNDFDLNISDSLFSNYNDLSISETPVPYGSFQIKLFNSNGNLIYSRACLGYAFSKDWFGYLSKKLIKVKDPKAKARFISSIPDLYNAICQ